MSWRARGEGGSYQKTRVEREGVGVLQDAVLRETGSKRGSCKRSRESGSQEREKKGVRDRKSGRPKCHAPAPMRPSQANQNSVSKERIDRF